MTKPSSESRPGRSEARGGGRVGKRRRSEDEPVDSAGKKLTRAELGKQQRPWANEPVDRSTPAVDAAPGPQRPGRESAQPTAPRTARAGAGAGRPGAGADAGEGHVAGGVQPKHRGSEEPVDPPDEWITCAEVSRRTGLSPTVIYRQMRAGEFPEPFVVGVRSVRWSAREVEAWKKSRPRSHGDGIRRARKRKDEAGS